MNFYWVLLTTLVAGVLLALLLPVARRWLLVAGVVLLLAFWLIQGIASDGYEGLDGGWSTAFLILVLWGVVWSAGLAGGRLIRRLVHHDASGTGNAKRSEAKRVHRS